jgi:hypothetical protein
LCVEQVEIDEYRDYEKAIGALREALKYLTKDTSRAAEDMAHSIERRIMLIEKFVQVCSLRCGYSLWLVVSTLHRSRFCNTELKILGI